MLNVTYIYADGHTTDYHASDISAAIFHMAKNQNIIAAHTQNINTGEVKVLLK